LTYGAPKVPVKTLLEQAPLAISAKREAKASHCQSSFVVTEISTALSTLTSAVALSGATLKGAVNPGLVTLRLAISSTAGLDLPAPILIDAATMLLTEFTASLIC